MKRKEYLFGTAGLLVAIGFVLLFQFYGCSGVSSHIQRGDELIKAELHEEALAEYQSAAKLDPDNPEAKIRIAKVKQTLAAAANDEGLSILEMKDYPGAIAAFKRAVQFSPEDTSYKKNLSRTAKQMLVLGRKALDKKEFKKAVSIFLKLRKQLPNDAETKQALEETKVVWAKDLFEDAEQQHERKLFGNALISLVRINKMVGIYRSSAALEAEARGELKTAAVFGIAVLPGKVKKRFTKATAKVILQLGRVKVEQCPTVSIQAEDEPRVKTKIAVTNISFDQDQETSTGEQKYQSGTRKVDNPKYLELEKKITGHRLRIAELSELLAEDDKIIEQSRQAFADAGPSDDDEALRKRLKGAEKLKVDHGTELRQKENEVVDYRNTLTKTPRKLDEPVFDVHRYDITKVTRTAKVAVQVTIRDEGGIKLIQEEVSGSASTSDSSNPANRKFGVKADPLRFPKTDDELTEAALEKATEKTGKYFRGLCARWQKEILSRARQARNAAIIEATEDYVLYLFVVTGEPPAEVVQFLKQQFGFSDIEALRGNLKD